MSQPPSHPGVITSLPPLQPQPSYFPPHSCQQSSTDPTKSSLSSQSTSSPLSSQSYQAHSQSPCSSRQALLSRLTGKCLCLLVKTKASDFFDPLQFGVACPLGSEKVIHGIRNCVDQHWGDDDFAVLKVDLKNAFNLVSRQAFLDECAFVFPNLLPWAFWCYGVHSILWHPMGHLSSKSGVQQGDPLGPLLFALVLHKVISAIDADDECLNLLYQAWYMDDGVLAGKRSALVCALSLIMELGPSLGLLVNIGKCELFCKNDVSMFPEDLKVSTVPHFEILGAPIGDYIYCASFVSTKRSEALKLLLKLEDVAIKDPQVALLLLRMCGSFSKLVHLARTTPTTLVSEAFQQFDSDVKHCLSSCIANGISDSALHQAQISLSRGGLGLRSLSKHSCAAFIASFCSSGFAASDNSHLIQAVAHFNSLVSQSDATKRHLWLPLHQVKDLCP